MVLLRLFLVELLLGSLGENISEELKLADLELGIELWTNPFVKCSGMSQSALGVGEAIPPLVINAPLLAKTQKLITILFMEKKDLYLQGKCSSPICSSYNSKISLYNL